MVRLGKAQVFQNEHESARKRLIEVEQGDLKEERRDVTPMAFKGLKGIEDSGVIRASDQNKVFAESARSKPLSPRDAEATYGLKQGRGRNYVETDVPADQLNRVYNPLTKSYELQVIGDLRLQNPTFHVR